MFTADSALATIWIKSVEIESHTNQYIFQTKETKEPLLNWRAGFWNNFHLLFFFVWCDNDGILKLVAKTHRRQLNFAYIRSFAESLKIFVVDLYFLSQKFAMYGLKERNNKISTLCCYHPLRFCCTFLAAIDRQFIIDRPQLTNLRTIILYLSRRKFSVLFFLNISSYLFIFFYFEYFETIAIVCSGLNHLLSQRWINNWFSIGVNHKIATFSSRSIHIEGLITEFACRLVFSSS